MSTNRKISNLPAVIGVNLQDTDILPLVASGVTSKTTIADLRVKLGFNVPAGGRTVTDPSTYFSNNAVANVKDFGAFGDNSHNDSSAVQAAINTGLDVYFPPGTYKVTGLTQATNLQVLFSSGMASIKKNGNGAIIASTGADVTYRNLLFLGVSASFTGDNITFTGDRCSLIACGSQDAAGRAVKATGNSFYIRGGQRGAYQTADATGTGYDIEIGVSGTATLYHQLFGVYTSQNTGGILMTDVGEHVLFGSQFGKLTLKNGTGPAGTGGGKTIGCRILGPITVELSGGSFIANHRGTAATVTFAVGTSGSEFLEYTTNAGAAITNNGNANNVIIRQISGGGTMKFQYGDDASITTWEITPNSGTFKASRGFIVPNNNGTYMMEKSTGGSGATWSMSSADNVALISSVADKAIQLSQPGTAGLIQSIINGNVRLEVNQHGPKLPTFTVATRPAAADGTIIFVSDGGAGANFQGRAGGAWVNLG